MSYGFIDDCNRTPNFSYVLSHILLSTNPRFHSSYSIRFLVNNSWQDKGDLDKGREI